VVRALLIFFEQFAEKAVDSSCYLSLRKSLYKSSTLLEFLFDSDVDVLDSSVLFTISKFVSNCLIFSLDCNAKDFWLYNNFCCSSNVLFNLLKG
jgi:hypothetical protein